MDLTFQKNERLDLVWFHKEWQGIAQYKQIPTMTEQLIGTVKNGINDAIKLCNGASKVERKKFMEWTNTSLLAVQKS